MTAETRVRYARPIQERDALVHIVAGLPARAKWGVMACGALFQWEPGTERRASRTDDAATCIACVGYVGRRDW